MPAEASLAFLPVSILGTAEDPPEDRPGPLTLEIGDVRILVPATFSATHLNRVIATVRGAS